jgi:amino acid adenylation domain-containing protein
MLPKFPLADEMQDLQRRSIAQASQKYPTAQRRNQAQRVSTRETEHRSFPLSFAQQRLWVLDRLEPGNGVYNLAFAVRLDGALDPDALQSALDEIVGCHEILRAEFHVEDDAPVQVILPRHAVAVTSFDLIDTPVATRDSRVSQLMAEVAGKPFDLSRGPLLRIRILRLSPSEHILLLVVHRIICDEQSLQILFAEIAACYSARLRGEPWHPDEASLGYLEFASAQRERLFSDELRSQLAYWKRQLAGAPSSVDLPTDHTRPPVQSFRGDTCTAQISSTLYKRLQDLSRSQQVTLFITLVTAFNILLGRYSAQDDLVLGTEVSGRTRAEMQNAIGLFANQLVLRTNVSGDPRVSALLRQVHATVEAAHACQDIPFEHLVDELNPERDLSRTPLFQIAFNLHTSAVSQSQIPGMTVMPIEVESKTESFDLSVNLVERAGSLDAKFRYNPDLFGAETIARMAGHFHKLLEGIVVDQTCRISELPLLSDAEERRILAEFNRTEFDYPRNVCLHELLAAQARHAPQAAAVQFEGQSLTYAELDGRANQLASLLRKHGVKREVLVGLCIERSLEMVVALLGILKAGGAYVPLDPAYPGDRIKYVLDDAQVKVLITQASLLSSLPPTSAALVCLDPEWTALARESDEKVAAGASPENLAYVIYTSGSTGKPKGVQLEHCSVVNFLCSMQREPGLSAKDVLVAVTTLSFDIAGLEMYLPLISGARLVIASREQTYDGWLLAQLIERSGATVMQATPATWRLLFESGWKGNRKLKVLVGGEALSSELARELVEHCGEVWNMYGPTETTVWSTVYRVEGKDDRTVPIGRPIANTRTYILDANRVVVPIGVPGELYIGGDGLARGYFQRPDLTAERFVSNPFNDNPQARMYRTGDLARFLPDGNIQYLGRVDNQVKIRGFRIELGEIEAVLARHSTLQTAVVVPREDKPGDKRLVAYLTFVPGKETSSANLRAFLKESLPEYMIPSAFVMMDALPLTPNGKINRRALPAPDWSQIESGASIAPRDQLEVMLVKTWRKELGIQNISITDNFFDLGGHSLVAARLLSEVKKITGRQIPLSALFRGATVESLAQLIREGGEANPDPVVMEIQSGGDGLPFFAVASPGVETLGFGLLARHMGPDRPVYKLQGHAPIVAGRPFTKEDLRLLSQEYIAAMRAVQPEGPYCLGGMCEGVQIAERLVCDLEAQGQVVSLFAIFDTWVLQHSQRVWLWRLEYFRQRLREFKNMNLSQQWETCKRAVGTRWGMLTGESRGRSEWYRAYWPEDFTPGRFRAPVVLFKRPKQPFYYVDDPEMGWGRRSESGVEIHEIEFDHEEILREPYVHPLGEQLEACIRRLDKRIAESAFPPPQASLISTSSG